MTKLNHKFDKFIEKLLENSVNKKTAVKNKKTKRLSVRAKTSIESYINNSLLDLKSHHVFLDKNILLLKLTISLLILLLILSLAFYNLTFFVLAVILVLSYQALIKLLKLRASVKKAIEIGNFIEMTLLRSNSFYNELINKLMEFQKEILLIQESPISLFQLNSLRKNQIDHVMNNYNDLEIISEFKKLK